jgi:hypothetical protein
VRVERVNDEGPETSNVGLASGDSFGELTSYLWVSEPACDSADTEKTALARAAARASGLSSLIALRVECIKSSGMSGMFDVERGVA